MQDKPKIIDDELYQLLRADNIEQFNTLKEGRELPIRFSGLDFKGLDLRGIHAQGIDFSQCYFHQTDLRGIDFSKSKLEGASINNASISGCYFPKELTADEIRLSNTHGTRMRYCKICS